MRGEITRMWGISQEASLGTAWGGWGRKQRWCPQRLQAGLDAVVLFLWKSCAASLCLSEKEPVREGACERRGLLTAQGWCGSAPAGWPQSPGSDLHWSLKGGVHCPGTTPHVASPSSTGWHTPLLSSHAITHENTPCTTPRIAVGPKMR